MIADMSGPDCPKCGEYFLDCTCKTWLAPSEDAYMEICKHLKTLFVEYFLNVRHPDFKEFKDFTMEGVVNLLDRIHDKYADHIEGLIRERNNYGKRNSTDSKTA